jgi:hypothetical protein
MECLTVCALMCWQLEAEKAAEIAALIRQGEEQLQQLASNSQAMMEGEVKAIETGIGDMVRIPLLSSDVFGGHTSIEFHFRLAESQFLRMTNAGGQYHVTKVEYIINPPLLKRYHDFKKAMLDRGEVIKERLTFHGTTASAIEKILKEGFKIGGMCASGL